MRGYEDKRTKCIKQTNKHRALAKVHAFFLLENSLFWKTYWLVFFFFNLQFLQLFIYVPYDAKGPQFSSVQFSRSVMSDSLRPCESQQGRPPCLSPSPGVHSVHRVRDAIQPSHPGSSPSPPAPNLSQHQGLFQ